MANPKFLLENISGKRILIAALDWGMGHTTRCVGLIQRLMTRQNQIIFAGSLEQCTFITREFPNIKTEELAGYDVLWDGQKNPFRQMLSQQKKILGAIKMEEKWVASFLKENEINLVISDNRYGFRNNKVHSILLTHQLNLQLPLFRACVNGWLHRKINRFDTCWVPDSKDQLLTGELSNFKGVTIPIEFIGWLNRLGELPVLEKKYDYLIIYSGPEPERSLFFNHLVRRFQKNGEQRLCVVGKAMDGVDSFSNPTTTELRHLFACSETIVSRAGYTTIMELVSTEKKGMLYPTKGQYEQEYLARALSHSLIQFELSGDQ